MDALFAQFLLPVLAVVTGIFLVVGFKAMRVMTWQKDHDKKADDRFTYTRKALTGVSAQVDDLHGKINADVLPRFDDFYKKLVAVGVDLDSNTLLQELIGIGFDKADFLTKDKSIIVCGLSNDNYKITLLLSLFNDNSDLHIYSFAFRLSSLPSAFVEDILEMNSRLLIGSLGLRQIPDGHVLTVNHTLHLPNRRVQTEAIRDVISRICGVYDDLLPIMERHNAVKHELLVGDYLKLVADKESRSRELADGGGGPKAIASATKEGTAPEPQQNARQVSSEAAPSASPDEPSA